MKKMFLKKAVAFLLAGCLLTGAAACGGSSNTDDATGATPAPEAGTETETETAAEPAAEPAADPATAAEPAESVEETTLRIMYTGQGTYPDTQMVIDAFNEKLAEFMPGTKADIEFVLSTNYEERLRLVLSANEAIDVANLNSGAGEAKNDIVTQSRMGAMMQLDDLLANKPEFFELIPENLWSMSRVGGATYMIPINKPITDRFVGVNMHAELADEYMDLPRLREILGSDNGSVTQETWDILTNYLKNLKDAGQLMYGASPATMRWLPERAFYSIQGKPFAVHKEDDTCQVVNFYETEDAKLMFKTFNEWWNAGYIMQDQLSAENPRAMEHLADGNTLFMAGHHYSDPTYTGPIRQWNAEETNTENWAYPVRSVGWEKNIFIAPVGTALQGLFIPRTSENPEKALDYIYLTSTNWDLYGILAYGLEGVHYTRTEDGNNVDAIIKEADQARYSGAGWNVGNQFLVDPYSEDGSEWADYSREITMGRAITTPLASFQVDIEPIKQELEQYNAVLTEYEWALDCGAVEDWEGYYNEMIEKMKAAGSDKILAELQSQIDTYLANK